MWLSPEHAASDLARRLVEVQDAIRHEQEKQKALTEAGIIRATTWWKDGKYLYLLYPSSVLAKRRRDYVGADLQKIKEAQEAIQRAKQYDQSKQLERQLHHQLNEAQRFIQYAHSALPREVSQTPHW